MNILHKAINHGDMVCEKFGLRIGRVLLAAIFLLSGIMKVMNFNATAGVMETAGMPSVTILLVIAIIIEIGAALALIFGWQVRNAARALILYTIVATYYFHMNLGDQTQMIMFMKNLAIIGGLFIVGAGAPGCKSCKVGE